MNRAAVLLLIITCMLALASCAARPGTGGGSSSSLPPFLWGGGGPSVKIVTQSSQPAKLKLHFTTSSGSGEKSQNYELDVKTGEQIFVVTVPKDTGGYFELGVPGAKEGASISCTLLINGREFWKDQATLNGPLGANEAFFVNAEFEDFEKK